MNNNITKIIKTITDTFNKSLSALKKKLVLYLITGIILILAAAALIIFIPYLNKIGGTKIISAEAAGQKVVDYVNKNILGGESKVTLKEVSEVSSMYKIKLNFEGEDQDVEAYVSRDGKYLFPLMPGIPIDLDQTTNNEQGTETQRITSCENVKKSDQPVLEAFVVSQCPYGLQAQRMLSGFVKETDNKENIKIRYIGSISGDKITSMHGDAEAQENLRQICLREETNKYWDYVSCYIKEGDTENCLDSVGVDKEQLNSCMSDISRGLKYAEEDFTLADQYTVSGSPAFILGGDNIDEFSFGGRTADAIKNIVCCGFNSSPDFCSKELSKESAATSFSETYEASSQATDSGSCE